MEYEKPNRQLLDGPSQKKNQPERIMYTIHDPIALNKTIIFVAYNRAKYKRKT